MRRTTDEDWTKQVMSHLEINKALAEGYKFQYERLCRDLIKNSKHGFSRVIRTFLTGIIFPALLWCLLNGYQVIKLGIKLLIDRYIDSVHNRH